MKESMGKTRAWNGSRKRTHEQPMQLASRRRPRTHEVSLSQHRMHGMHMDHHHHQRRRHQCGAVRTSAGARYWTPEQCS